VKQLANLDARIPKWKHHDLVERNCPICMSEGHEKYIRPDNLLIKYCSTCKTYFVSPSPSETQLRFFYSKYDDMHRRDASWKTELTDRYQLNDFLSDFRLQEIGSIVDLKEKVCLDVGFGRGFFLYGFKLLGASSCGVELDPKAILYAKKYLGIESVIQGTIFDLNDNTKYDVILMNDFIEHPLDPFNSFQKAASMLKDEGLLAILTPNASFVAENDEPIIFRVDLEHMQYFFFKTCFYLANAAGLEIVHLESLGFPYLNGIDKLPNKDLPRIPIKIVLKNAIKSLPGFQVANNIRRSFLKKKPAIEPDHRAGNYHLFCIFQKSSERLIQRGLQV